MQRARLSGLARFGSDGSFSGHLHTKTSTLIGLAKLGRYLVTHGQPDHGKRYLLAARRSYDWLFTPTCGASLTGWIPERPGVGYSETCCAADVLELAEVLASCAELAPEFRAWSGLHDDVERMAVNVPAATQIRFTPELVNYLQACYGPDAPAQLDLARKFNGTWSSTFFPNDLCRHDGVILGGCCMYSGVTTLHTGWHDALQWADGTLQVNYFLTRSSPQAEITTAQPARGEARIRLRQPCMVRVRVPAWLTPGKMRFSIDGSDLQTTGLVDATGRFVSLGPGAAGACVDIHFPLEERTTSEQMGGKTFTACWRGNYVVRMEPAGDFLPLFPP